MTAQGIALAILPTALLVLFSGCTPSKSQPAPAPTKPMEMKRDGPPNAFDLCNTAEEKIAAGNYVAALKDLEGAASLQPKMARIFHLKGVVHGQLGQAQEALKAFVSVMAIDAKYNNTEFRLEAGEVFLAANQPRATLGILGRAESLSPRLRLLSARARVAAGDHRGALADIALAKAEESTREEATVLEAKLEAQILARKTHYLPTSRPERLSEAELTVAGLASLRLPIGFKVRGKRARARREYGDTEVVLSLAKANVDGEGPAAWREAMASDAKLRSAYVAASRLSEEGAREEVFLHLVEPSAESGMFDPFNIVRYQWLIRGSSSQALVVVELEVPKTERDLPDDVRQDILAAVATLKVN